MTCTSHNDLDLIFREFPYEAPFMSDEVLDALEFVVIEQIDKPNDPDLLYLEGMLLGRCDPNAGKSFFTDWRKRLYREGLL